MSRPKVKTTSQIVNEYKARAYDRINYMPRKDAVYNKSALQAAAQRLTGGSVTALLNAAVADYLPRALGAALPGILADGEREKEGRQQHGSAETENTDRSNE